MRAYIRVYIAYPSEYDKYATSDCSADAILLAMDYDRIVVLQPGTHNGSHSPPELQYRVREWTSVARPFRVMKLK